MLFRSEQLQQSLQRLTLATREANAASVPLPPSPMDFLTSIDDDAHLAGSAPSTSSATADLLGAVTRPASIRTILSLGSQPVDSDRGIKDGDVDQHNNAA